jgi:2-hydroxy-3-keto-5-methylthiopentenyl-1-phosphate phosphatase
MKRIILCDFDGTITVAETFVAMATSFAPEMSQYGSIKQIPFLVLVRVD